MGQCNYESVIMMQKLIYILCVCTYGLYFTVTNAVLIGSDTTPTRFTTQQVLNNGDVIAAFAGLQAGFRLTSTAVTGTFRSFFAVSGDVDLNAGTLLLGLDLMLSNTCALVRFGNIVGAGRRLQLASSNTTIPTTLVSPNSFTLSDLNLILTNNSTLNGTTLTFTGTSAIDGGGNVLTMGASANIVVGANSTLSLRNIIIKGVTGQNIRNTANTGTISMDDVILVLSGAYTFGTGVFTVSNNVMITGNQLPFIYTSDQISTILPSSSLIVDLGMTFSYAPSVVSKTRLQFTDSTSAFVLNSGTLQASAVGMLLTKGKLLVDGASFLVSDAVATASAIQFGDGVSAANNCMVVLSPGAGLDLLRGYVAMDNL